MRRRIGSGAFATVWLAYDEHLDSAVAIKVLADNWTGDHHIRQRFLEEGRFLRKVESPHVVTVYDAGELEDERPYLVMAYADQGTLADLIELSPLSRSQALSVITQVGRGLTALHDRGVLHRDVKPANVLFRTVENGRGAHIVAMLGDLGLGKAMDMSSRLTMAGGTPSYVAPEQALGEGLDSRADQFSLAALSYHLLTGRQPYAHASLAAAENPAPPAPMEIDDPAVEEVVLRGLAKDREDRFPDVAAFSAALAEAVGEPVDETPAAWIPADPDLTRAAASTEATGMASDPQPPASRGRRHRRWAWVAAAVLALVAGTGAGLGAGAHGHLRGDPRGLDRHALRHRAGVLDRPGRSRAVGALRGTVRAGVAGGRHPGRVELRRRPGRGRLRRHPARRGAAVPRAGPCGLPGPARSLLRREGER